MWAYFIPGHYFDYFDYLNSIRDNLNFNRNLLLSGYAAGTIYFNPFKWIGFFVFAINYIYSIFRLSSPLLFLFLFSIKETVQNFKKIFLKNKI